MKIFIVIFSLMMLGASPANVFSNEIEKSGIVEENVIIQEYTGCTEWSEPYVVYSECGVATCMEWKQQKTCTSYILDYTTIPPTAVVTSSTTHTRSANFFEE